MEKRLQKKRILQKKSLFKIESYPVTAWLSFDSRTKMHTIVDRKCKSCKVFCLSGRFARLSQIYILTHVNLKQFKLFSQNQLKVFLYKYTFRARVLRDSRVLSLHQLFHTLPRLNFKCFSSFLQLSRHRRAAEKCNEVGTRAERDQVVF